VRGVIVKKLVSNIRLNGYVHRASNTEPQIPHQKCQDGPCGHPQRTGAEARARQDAMTEVKTLESEAFVSFGATGDLASIRGICTRLARGSAFG
jgi:hypothetical protein